MMKIKYLVLLSFVVVLFQSCNKDVSSPPQPSFTVDKTTGQADSTVFTFTINQVNADAISLFPYGTEDATYGGIYIPNTSFVDGKTTVTFQYANTGTFNAVVVANNHSTNGSSIKNVRSSTTQMTIFSSWCAISVFSFSGINSTVTINEAAKTIDVTVPYAIKANKLTDVTELVANFTASPFATVAVGGATQTSGTTVNDFTNPVSYVVTAGNGQTATYTVTVTKTPVETDNTLKSATGIEASTSAKNKVIPAYVGTDKVVLYDTLGTPASSFDSVQFNYATNGSFAIVKLSGKALAQGHQFDLTASSHPEIVVYAQDSTMQTYTVYAVQAPKLTLSFNSLNPTVVATTTNFAINANVFNGTDLTAVATTADWSQVPSGVTVNSVTANGTAFSSGDAVDYTSGATFVLNVTDANLGGIQYQITYKATVNVVQ